jgi:hypothetical protein
MAGRWIYQIRVQGQISERWAPWFEEMAVRIDQDAGAASTTMLSGPVVDQAALFGLLHKLYNLGLPLLSVRRIEPEDNGVAFRIMDDGGNGGIEDDCK